MKIVQFYRNFTDFAQSFTDSINAFIKKNVVITDTDNIIAFTGEKKKQFINQPISKQLDDYIQRRENILEKHQKELSIIEGDGIECTYTINTIVANGDALGLVIIFSEEEKTMEIDERIVQIAAQFLSKYLEDQLLICYNHIIKDLEGKKFNNAFKRIHGWCEWIKIVIWNGSGIA